MKGRKKSTCKGEVNRDKGRNVYFVGEGLGTIILTEPGRGGEGSFISRNNNSNRTF